jgi:predicted MPP superfamily phosphohydrolase
VTDIHVGSPRSFRFKPAWNENWQTARKQILAVNPDFLLIGGDLTRDGQLHKFELEAIKADLDALPFPYHAVPGNMDTGNKHTDVSSAKVDDVSLNITPTLLENFISVFGSLWWSFVHNGVRFSGFCDMLVGSGTEEEDRLWQWMQAQTKLPKENHHVWITHYPLFLDDLHEPNFDISDPRQYLDWYFGIDEPGRGRIMDVFKATGADLVISGHVHCRKTSFRQGIRFDINPSSAFGQWADRWEDGDVTLGFVRYDVSDEGIISTFVPLENVSTRKGYGPGGHPGPEERDYSIAWEK